MSIVAFAWFRALGDTIITTVGVAGLGAGGTQVTDTIGMCISVYVGMAKSEFLELAKEIVGFWENLRADVKHELLKYITLELRIQILELIPSMLWAVEGESGWSCQKIQI
jgi:hypothetical protein